MSTVRSDHSRILGRYAVLLGVLLLLLFGSPWLASFVSAPGVIAVVIVVAIAVTLRDRPAVAGVIVFAGLVAVGAHVAAPRPWLAFGANVALLALGSGTIVIDVLGRPMRRSEAVAGGASAYLLVGFLFGMIYALLLTLDPAALNLPEGPEGTSDTLAAFYFSFVTLTTLGYGDITPASPMARSTAATEAVIGVLFISAIIARALAAPDLTEEAPPA